MNYYPPSIRNAIKQISRLPGIGEKTAERLAMHILRAPRAEAENLAHSILNLKQNVRLCRRCYSLSDGDVCNICRDQGRNARLLCVVEQPADMVSLEKSGAFNGLYHILGGTLSPMNGIGPGDIRIGELLSRLGKEHIEEVVLATSTTVEGESTASYLADKIAGHNVKVTRIASGVPIGGDLKYVDQVTLRKAMEGRHNVK